MEFQLPAGATAPALARATLAAVAHPPPEVAGDIALLTSEVVTNAIRHSGSAPLDDVIVRVDPREDAVRVEVLNPGPSFDPQVPASPSRTGTGLGLFLVDALASRWGVETEDGRTKVWFEVPTDRGADAAAG
jgi:anti-sigma regulatory factor (Ser/Thr protein kinase)